LVSFQLTPIPAPTSEEEEQKQQQQQQKQQALVRDLNKAIKWEKYAIEMRALTLRGALHTKYE
jgi:hypothetical protein